MTSTLFLAQAAGSGTSAFMMNVLPLLLIFAVFYFLLIRPQQRRMKDHQAKIAAASRGDTVVTAGGVVGKITKIDDDYAEVEVASGVKVKVVRSTLSDVIDAKAKPAND